MVKDDDDLVFIESVVIDELCVGDPHPLALYSLLKMCRDLRLAQGVGFLPPI
jgi:hypothetical protein